MDEFVDQRERLLLYVGRYGHQDVTRLRTTVTTEELIRWMHVIDDMLKREHPSK